MIWRILAAMSLAYFAAGVALQFAPQEVTAHVVALKAQARATAACRIAELTSPGPSLIDITSDLG